MINAGASRPVGVTAAAVLIAIAACVAACEGGGGAGNAEKTSATLYQQYGCSSCHAADRKLVGPAFRDIAARYRGRADAEALLVAKVRSGGAGVWGQVAMPPHPALPDGALHEMIRTILAQPAS